MSFLFRQVNRRNPPKEIQNKNKLLRCYRFTQNSDPTNPNQLPENFLTLTQVYMEDNQFLSNFPTKTTFLL